MKADTQAIQRSRSLLERTIQKLGADLTDGKWGCPSCVLGTLAIETDRRNAVRVSCSNLCGFPTKEKQPGDIFDCVRALNPDIGNFGQILRWLRVEVMSDDEVEQLNPSRRSRSDVADFSRKQRQHQGDVNATLAEILQELGEIKAILAGDRS